MDYLSPYAFASEQRLLAYLKREREAVDGDREAAVDAGNSAIGWMESFTGRRLACRVYRAAVSLGSCTIEADQLSVTGSGFTGNAKLLDDLAAATLLAPGTRIAAIASDAALTLSRKATAGTATLTAGSALALMDGTGKNEMRLPDHPVSEVYSAAWVDGAGTATALVTTGARLDPETGLYILPSDVFPEGRRNIQLGFKAGYVEPSGSDRGHWGEWATLQRIFLRVSKVFFEDERLRGGRIVSESVAQSSASLPDFKMPADVIEAIQPFVRRW